MAEQEQARKTAPVKKIEGDSADADTADGAKIGLEANQAARLGKIDDILDEIDEVLETNAEDFVRSYIQKGGQ